MAVREVGARATFGLVLGAHVLVLSAVIAALSTVNGTLYRRAAFEAARTPGSWRGTRLRCRSWSRGSDADRVPAWRGAGTARASGAMKGRPQLRPARHRGFRMPAAVAASRIGQNAAALVRMRRLLGVGSSEARLCLDHIVVPICQVRGKGALNGCSCPMTRGRNSGTIWGHPGSGARCCSW